MNNRGFTIIEVLISIILTAIILIGGMAFFTNASALATLASHKKIATHIANTRLEEISKQPYLSIAEVTDNPCYVTPPVIGDLTLSCTETITEISAGGETYKQAEVTVGWTEANIGPKSVVFTTYIAP